MRVTHLGRMAGAVALVTVAGSRPALAYSADTHFGIVSWAWEVMRATADPNFVDHIAWKSTAPQPLSNPLTCDLCGGAPTAGEWKALTDAMQPALAKLNTLLPELPAVCPAVPPATCKPFLLPPFNIPFPIPTPPECVGIQSSDGTLGGVLVGMDPGTQPDNGLFLSCAHTLGRHQQGGAYDGQWHPGGIYDATAPNPAIDGMGYQGLALGWHAKAGDDDLDDVVLNGGLLTAILAFALIVAALIVLGIVSEAALAVGAVVLIVIALISCIYGWLSGDGCVSTVAKVGAAIARDTGLEGLMSEVGGAIRTGTSKSSDYTGVWHFINSNGAGTNSYDDKRGLYWDEAGPDGDPGQLDMIIQLGLDVAAYHLDYDLSKGPKQYQVTTSDDSHPNSTDRDRSDWQGPDAAHLEFAPLDNFGYFGWKQFRGTRNAHFLRWPLHALGDATVPMHISGTSAWGHRPYEDTLTFGQKWSEMRFLKPLKAPELLGANRRTCYPVSNPSQRCPEEVGAATDDFGSANQVEQARRILQHALRWRRFIAAWRTRTGRTTDVPMRDIITQLAAETRTAFDTATDPRWPFCDDCSMDYAFNEDHNDKGRTYYKDVGRLRLMRALVERSVGATVAFLVAAADSVPPAPVCSTTTCSATTPCCHGSCQQGVCCGGSNDWCGQDTDCCAGTPACRNSQCGPATTPQQPGGTCELNGTGCSSGQCATTPDGRSVCCAANGVSCTGPSGCCSGYCGDDHICALFPVGTTCTSAAQCASNGCAQTGVPVTPGVTGQCCNLAFGAECHPENGNADCCSGTCQQVGSDEFQCQRSTQCLSAGSLCANSSDCCTGVCFGHEFVVCICSAAGAACSTSADCCTSGSACTNGFCVAPIPPIR